MNKPVLNTVAICAAIILTGSSGAPAVAAAQAAIDVPAQVFDRGQAAAKPVVRWRPNASTWDRTSSQGTSFRVDLPVGAEGRTPITVHLLSAEEQCRDSDVTSAATDRDDDFVRDARGR